MGQKRFINRISPFELIKSDALLGGSPRQPTTIGKLLSHHGERHHEAERELGISEQKHHRPALLNNNEGESRLLCFCLYIARGDTKNNGYLDDLRSLTIVAGRKPAVFLLYRLHLTTRSSQKGAFRLAERKMILSLSFVLPFLLFHAIPSSVAAPCNGTTTGIKSCQSVTAGQLSCTFLVPLISVTGTAPVSIIVKGLASSSIVVTTASATSTGSGCGSSGITIAGPTYLADSSAGVNNIALFTMPVPATPADVEVTVTAVFNSVGATSSDAVGVWVNDRLLVSWSATTVSTPISDVCSPSNWTTIASTCSDLTVGFFEPVVCTLVIPVLVTKAKTVYDVQLKLLTPAPDVRFERAALTATLGNNCTNATVPKHEIKMINTAVTYSSSSYWYDTSVLIINFYGDFATSAQLAYKLQVDFFVSQINSLMPPSTPVLSLAVISNDGVSTNQTVSIPSTTIVPTSAYLSCNQRGLYYLDWTTCKSVYVATTSGSLRLLLNTSFDIQIEDAQVPQFYCTDCGITLPTVTITNFVSSRSTGYVDVTW
uniref:Uncharacterized protein n=1 Tax=Plectus sambesii TaxID=2011161 RepID=A0A914XE09_9BILA